ncbi:MAG: hypothetical protein ACPGVI_00135 [Crocinitomicaceae bacterium]
MKKTLLLALGLFSIATINAQIINDNKVSFSYTQLPLIKIDEAFNTYEVRVQHGYQQANQDSLQFFQMRQQAALENYERAIIQYEAQRKNIERIHLENLANWQKKVNSGVKNPDGSALERPNDPLYPVRPQHPIIKAPRLHSEYLDENVNQAINLSGFEKGMGGSLITINVLPIRDIKIVKSKSGSGSSTKYKYSANYILPIEVLVQSPSQGTLLERQILTARQSYKMKEFKSEFEHDLYMLDNEDRFYTELELSARQKALREANTYINNQMGYVKRTRTTEIYSVKRFKNYEYSDATEALTMTTQALQLVSENRDRTGAKVKLEAALQAWETIMEESNTYDNKARVNDKISAMIQCNIAEIYIWLSRFNEANAMLNQVKNAGVMKGKNHAKRVDSYYTSLEKRWNANY